jgi:hypothetical protein
VESSESFPAIVEFPAAGAWRVARRASPGSFAELTPQDAALPNAGNRFDVLGGGVLYAATRLEGCYAETLARFRPSPRVLAAIRSDDGYMNAGSVPADWRERRCKFEIRCLDPLPFLDVEDPLTHTYLTSQMAAVLVSLGVNTPLDVASLRGANRLLTRAIALWAYGATDEQDLPVYSGIRYKSRLGDWECWAIFQGTELEFGPSQGLEPEDSTLASTAAQFGLVIH